MEQQTQVVTNADELQDAVKRGVAHITVEGEIRGMPMLALQPGQTLTGGTLYFGASGVQLSRDNTLSDITIRTSETERAILNDTGVTDLGTLTLHNVRTTGQVALLLGGATRGGHVRVENLHIERADVRGRAVRPHAYGVDAMQGAFTLWNTHTQNVVITAELLNLSAGSVESPVRGSGVFVGGQGQPDGTPEGGRVQVKLLTTGEIHADGGIAENTPDLISGGVFVIYGAFVEHVENLGAVTTYGPNDMVLDNWGNVREWIARAPVVSRGTSGIGFVQFGEIGSVRVEAPIETFGKGARGFNLYAGNLQDAAFHSINTHADGAVGIQVSRDLPRLSVEGDVTTQGGESDSLVKGKVIKLKAYAVSVQPGGQIGELSVGGELSTEGQEVVTLQVQGKIDRLDVRGGIHALGEHSDAVMIEGGDVPLEGTKITARDGERIRVSQPKHA
ncbi:MAG TPA: hypothetical protein VF276_01425 [Chloroflexia bacterium]